MPVANVRSKWSAGNLIFYESVAGNGAYVQFGEDASGMDMKFFGATSGNYMQWDESADSLLLIGENVRFRQGTFSSATAGSGVAISETVTAAARFYADDAGVAIGTATGSVPDVKNVLVRTLITKDNSSFDMRLHSLMGQLKSVDGEWGDEQVSAVHGYLELIQSSGTITLQSYGVTAGVMATVETQGTFGVVVTHNLAGFAAISKLGYSGTFTDNTNTSGLYVGIYDSTNWSDSPTLDKWNHGLYVQAAAADKGIQIGELSSVTQTGLTLVSGSGYEAVSVYSDDGNATLTGGTPFAGIHTRTMFFVDQDQGTTVIGNWGQLKYYTGVDIGPARVAAVEGYNELLTTNIVKSGGEVTSVNAVIDVVAGVFTVNSTGIATGFHAKLTGAGEAVQDSGGYLAGLKIDSDITTGKWGYGIYIQAGAVDRAIKVGELSSNTPGSGVLLDASNTRAVEVHADDNDTARAVGTLGRAIFGRTMIYEDNGCEDWGIDGLSKISAVAKTANVSAGVVGRFESTGTCSLATGSGNTFVAGVMGRLGLAANMTLGAGTYACGVLAFYNTLAASDPSGEYTVAFMATASDLAGTGDWDYGLYIEDTANGIYSTTTTQAYNMIVSALPANARGARLDMTCATPAMSDGIGAFENNFSIGGSATGSAFAASTWTNVGGSGVAAGNTGCHSDGIYADSGGVNGAAMCISRFQFISTDSNFSQLSIWQLNFNQTIDCIFDVNDRGKALGLVVDTPTAAAVGSIPFLGTNGVDRLWIRVYTDATT